MMQRSVRNIRAGGIYELVEKMQQEINEMNQDIEEKNEQIHDLLDEREALKQDVRRTRTALRKEIKENQTKKCQLAMQNENKSLKQENTSLKKKLQQYEENQKEMKIKLKILQDQLLRMSGVTNENKDPNSLELDLGSISLKFSEEQKLQGYLASIEEK